MDSTEMLKLFVNRAINVKSQIEKLQAEIAEIYKDASDHGLDKKAIKEVVKRATMGSEELQAREQLDFIIETYWSNYNSGNSGDASRAPARTREYMAKAKSSLKAALDDAAEAAGLDEKSDRKHTNKLAEALA